MRLLALLGGQAITLGLTVAFLVVPASAVFLHTFGAGALPFAYIGVAIAGVAVSSAVTVAQRRMPLGRLALAVLTLYVVLVATAWVLLSRWDMAWVTFVLIVLFPLSIPTGFLLVGSQAVRLYDVQTLKRDFPRVVAGFSIGFAVGGLVAAALVAPLGGPTNLLLIDLVMALGFIGLVWSTSRQFPGQLLTAPSQMPAPQDARRTRSRLADLRLLREPFVLLVLGYQIVSAGVTQLFDYVVWDRAAAYYADPDSLAQFMGAFGAILNIVAVLFTLLLAGRLLSRFGIRFGLLLNPVGVLVMTIVVLSVGLGPGIATFTYLVAVCAAQIVDISLTDGTTRTSIAATYQGIRRGDRLRAQTFVEGAGIPIAVGLVGAYLLLVRALGLDVQAVVWTTGALTLVWILLAVKAYRGYAGHLGGVLADRSWDPVALRIDSGAADAIGRLLTSDDPIDRRTGIDVLRDARSPRLADAAVGALSDSDPSVRCTAVEALAGGGEMRRPEVRERVGSLLGDPDVAVRARAAAAVSRGQPGRREDGHLVWRQVLADEATSAHALMAAAAVPSAALVPDLIGLVRRGQETPGLREALCAHGDQLVDELEGWLDAGTVGPGLVALTTAAARGGGERGRALLLAALHDPRPEVSEAAATGLHRMRATAAAQAIDTRARNAVGTAVDRQLDRAQLVRNGLAVLEGVDEAAPLRDALRDELAEVSRRLLVLVGIVVPGISPARVTAGLMDEDDTTRGLAEELVDVALGRRAPHVLGVVAPGLHPSERDQTKDNPTSRDGTGGDAAELVRSIAVDPDDQWGDPWLRACALRVLPSVAPDAIPSVVSRVRARPPRRPTTGLELVLDETVDWLAQLEASRARRTSASASADAELP
ncbi:Npt1/Npt2 family nucleotide transporter [Intrasporangium sp.]|uniref:Npt1/Npt2 family nucleotide transporter n=1 Tax=Intrasporangium sp. TaxID=1925024 RepID=UPI0033654447